MQVSTLFIRISIIKICPEGKILNPATNRCVNIDGAIGKKLIKAKIEPVKKIVYEVKTFCVATGEKYKIIYKDQQQVKKDISNFVEAERYGINDEPRQNEFLQYFLT